MRPRTQLGVALALAVAARLAAAGDGAADLRGTYRMEGTARIAAPPALDRTLEVHADAQLAPGARAGDARVRLVANGQSCDLTARLAETGALAFPPGQRCPIDIQSPDAQGHVDGLLHAGHGRLSAGHLELSLSCGLEGRVKLRAGRQALGSGANLPALWLPELPVRGEAEVAIQGSQDHSRAAGR